ncbi:MAG: hypothetical protein FVQ79_04670 [Planctomycetes bacterium]|nr:hypothetical protein [Planctomycetota bacterium]
MRVLILCTGDECRSQMAEAFARRLRPQREVYSAGTEPAGAMHPLISLLEIRIHHTTYLLW